MVNTITLKTILIIEEIFSQNGIITRFIVTDSDKQYDSMNDDFFKIIWNLHRGGKTFPEIVKLLIENNARKIPISDFLHSIKLLRSYFAKSGIIINDYSASKPKDLNDEEYNLGKTLIDLTQASKMKDYYPLTLFSSETMEVAIKNNKWDFVFYAVPFNFLINAIRNPYLSVQLRQQLLETSFYFLFHFFFECIKDAPIHSRIGIIRLINTTIGISASLEQFEYIHIGHISTHPLENYFGMFRILRAFGKSVIIKKKLDELNLADSILTRLGISGAKVDYTLIEGKLMDNYSLKPFDIFKILWKKIIWPEFDIKNVIDFFTSYKTGQLSIGVKEYPALALYLVQTLL